MKTFILSKIGKHTILCSFIPLITLGSSCKEGKNNSKISNFESSTLKFFGLGMPSTEYNFIAATLFDKEKNSENPRTCVTVKNDFIDFGGFRSARIDQTVDKKYAFDWTAAALDFSGQIEAKVAGFSVASASVETRYRAASINTRISFGTTNDLELRSGTAYLKDFQLAQPAQKAANEINDLYAKLTKASNPSQINEIERKIELLSIGFYLLCGDRFVSQAPIGARFSSSIRVNFNDARSLLDFYVKAKAKVLGVSKESKESESFDRHLSDSIVEVAASQSGGSMPEYASLIKKLGLGEENSQASMGRRCLIEPFDFENEDAFKIIAEDQLSGCYKSSDMINSYIKDSFYSQVNAKNGDLDIYSLVPLDHYYISYENANLLSGPLRIPTEVKNVLLKINELLKFYRKLVILRENLLAGKERSEIGSRVNKQWNQVGSETNSLLLTVESLLKKVKTEGEQCVSKVTNGDYTPCTCSSLMPSSSKDCDLRKLNLGDISSYVLFWGNL